MRLLPRRWEVEASRSSPARGRWLALARRRGRIGKRALWGPPPPSPSAPPPPGGGGLKWGGIQPKWLAVGTSQYSTFRARHVSPRRRGSRLGSRLRGRTRNHVLPGMRTASCPRGMACLSRRSGCPLPGPRGRLACGSGRRVFGGSRSCDPLPYLRRCRGRRRLACSGGRPGRRAGL